MFGEVNQWLCRPVRRVHRGARKVAFQSSAVTACLAKFTFSTTTNTGYVANRRSVSSTNRHMYEPLDDVSEGSSRAPLGIPARRYAAPAACRENGDAHGDAARWKRLHPLPERVAHRGGERDGLTPTERRIVVGAAAVGGTTLEMTMTRLERQEGDGVNTRRRARHLRPELSHRRHWRDGSQKKRREIHDAGERHQRPRAWSPRRHSRRRGLARRRATRDASTKVIHTQTHGQKRQHLHRHGTERREPRERAATPSDDCEYALSRSRAAGLDETWKKITTYAMTTA